MLVLAVVLETVGLKENAFVPENAKGRCNMKTIIAQKEKYTLFTLNIFILVIRLKLKNEIRV